MSRPLPAALLLAAATLGCHGSTAVVEEYHDTFVPSLAAPPRLAIVPVRVASGGHGLAYYAGRPFVWLADLVTLQWIGGELDAEEGAVLLRELLHLRLEDDALNVAPLAAVDAAWRETGDGPVEERVRRLFDVMDVDGVLVAELEEWGSRYFLLETLTVVRVRVRVFDQEGGLALHAVIESDDSEGILELPTGFVGLAASPLAGVDHGPLLALATECAYATADLVFDHEVDISEDAPRPEVVSVRVLDARSTYDAGDALTIEMRGTAGGRAVFDVGSARVHVPMVEVERLPPEEHGDEPLAVYRGSYVVQPGERLSDAPVLVTLWNDRHKHVERAADSLVTLDGR